MLRALVLLTAVCSVLAKDGFAEKYAYSKVMTNCFGEDLYYGWSKEVFKAVKECYGEEVQLPEAEGGGVVFGGGGSLESLGPGQIQRPADYPLLPSSRTRPRCKASGRLPIQALLSTPEARGPPIDDDFNIDYKTAIEETKKLDIADDLKEDLLEAMEKCKDLTMCLPLEKSGSPMPLKLQRIVALNKCWKKARLGVCMKHDLMKYLNWFDLSEFPADEDDDEGSKAEKLLHLLWGVEARDDFQLY
ncbi:hypothetical protein C7M84_000484 [Penaeus vannamei]|uniref:Uncharacterized protein n=1 Tax=Penaeus vannamei TaxID=6689 RepID=A0A3R7QJG0_PENVA|nr:hypothetical protein C7M84_000484 [Penaeus vannamei]